MKGTEEFYLLTKRCMSKRIHAQQRAKEYPPDINIRRCSNANEKQFLCAFRANYIKFCQYVSTNER